MKFIIFMAGVFGALTGWLFYIMNAPPVDRELSLEAKFEMSKEQLIAASVSGAEIQQLIRKIQSLKSDLLKANDKIVYERTKRRTRIVKITWYHPQSRGINSDSDPSNTAAMTKPVSGVHIAVSRDLKDWHGARIYLDSKKLPVRYRGVRWAHDLLNDRLPDKVLPNGTVIRGALIRNQIDIVAPSEKEAIAMGVVLGVEVRLIEEPEGEYHD